ncbi:MAG: bifunctional oligoribonuclease/PAP phosphatase NrnA [Phycisphaerae bacterium]
MLGNPSHEPSVTVIPDSLYQEAIERFRQAPSVALTTHVNGDADGLGSLAALRRWLLDLGTRVDVVLPTAPGETYAFLDPEGAFLVAGRDVDPAAMDPPALVCIVDTCTWQQLEGVEGLVQAAGAEVLVIDHHRTRDAVADLELVDPEAAAAVVLVHRLLTLAGADIDARTASALFVGLVGDTDGFRLPNVGPETFRLAGDLVEAGADPWAVHERLNLSDRLQKLHLWGRAAQTLHLACDGRVAVLHVTRAMLEAVDAERSDTEGLINTSLQVRGVRVGVMLRETEDGAVRVSLRSVPGVDVLQVAERFGGGGHTRAAGARTAGPLQEAEARVLEAVGAAVGGTPLPAPEKA